VIEGGAGLGEFSAGSRLVYDCVKPDRSDRQRRDLAVPHMNTETPAMLVRHLSHPNGWWRDTAQRLLVLTPWSIQALKIYAVTQSK
jgi:hypothetical protein